MWKSDGGFVMEMDIYEASAYYEFVACSGRDGVAFPRRLLIIDTDKYSVCFCECLEKGNYNKICEYVLPNKNDCITDMNNSLPQQIKGKDIFGVLDGRLDTFNGIMENYYRSEGQMDTSFKELIGAEIKCSDMENVFKTSEDKLNMLFSSLEGLWEQAGFEEENTNIMLIGKCADLFPIRYFVKAFFSFDPFLADERYVNDAYSDKPSQVYEIGKRLLEEKRRKEEEAFVCVYDNISGKKVKQKLLLHSEENGEIEYFGPIFVSAKDGLEFDVNSEKRNIALPYTVEPLDCDVVDVGLKMKKDVVVIIIRRFDYPTRIYEVPMSQ